MLNSSGESEHPCLVPDFRGNLSILSFTFFFTVDTTKLEIIYMAYILNGRCLSREMGTIKDRNESMNVVKLQDIKSTHRNPLHSYTLIMRK